MNERDLEKLALYWTQGGEILWDVLHEGEHPRLITLPTYPFARQRYWLPARAAEAQVEPMIEPTPAPQTPAGTDHERVRAFLLHFLSRELSLTPDQVRPHRDLRDHGADSITTMRLRRAVEETFQVHISGRDLLEHRTIHALSTYLAARLDGAQADAHAGVSRNPGVFLPLPLEEGTKDTPLQPVPPDALDQFKQGLLTLEDMEALLDQGEIG
jgi:acyl carrier protein